MTVLAHPFFSNLWLLVSGMALLLAGCAGTSRAPADEEAARAQKAMEYMAEARLVDDRGRFREVYCAVLEDHGEQLPDYMPCEEALTTVGEEAGATGEPVDLGKRKSEFLLLVVPGLGWECFEAWLDYDQSGVKEVAKYGYDVRLVDVDGLSSSTNNARQIRDFVAELPPELAAMPIVLAGYSKGAPDILEAVALYPELAQRVVGVVSFAGSVGGSPLADDAKQSQANLLTKVPGSVCEKGDEGAVASLRTDVRAQWMAENTLPAHIRYYSVITYPDPDRISWVLRNSYKVLSGVDASNDTQVLIYHQMIPGSTLLAFANADHWAIAVPIARQHGIVGSTVVNRNNYPREAFIEALVRYLDEDLATARHSQ